MKRIFILFIFIYSNSFSQKGEIGIFGGVTNYLGDLSPVAFAPTETQWSAGVVYKYNNSWYFTTRGAITQGIITGSDAENNAGEPFRIRRNLSFRNYITEASVMEEWNIWGYRGERYERTFTPYVEIGLALFHFNPQALYNGEWINLQGLGTEGQGLPSHKERVPYRLTQISVPMGMGVKLRVGEHWNITADCALRKTFTDYLDDVSKTYVNREEMLSRHGQIGVDLMDRSYEVATDSMKTHFPNGQMRGDPTKKDWYFFPGITITYTMKHSELWMKRHGLNPDECPTLRGN